jgi:anti-sigma regulatory factor (Ser/Thr protein kinase)
MRLSLFPTPEAPAEARRGLAVLSDLIDPGSLAEVRTVVSELVAISVSHGSSRLIDMRLTVVGSSLEGVIDDHGPAAAAIARLRQREEDPYALLIIDSLVEDWGRTLGSSAIWFRMAVHPARPAPVSLGAG